MDCEGCEAVLLDPALVPALRTTEVVVELHDFCSPHVSRSDLRTIRSHP
jgi:hypothetical protein